MKHRNHKFIILIIIFNLGFYCRLLSKDFTIVVNRPGVVILEARIDSVWLSNRHNSIIRTIPFMPTLQGEGFPTIPYFHTLLKGIPKNVNIQLFWGDDTLITMDEPLLTPVERAKGVDIILPLNYSSQTLYPETDYDWKAIGEINEYPIWSLEVYPIKLKNISEVLIRRQVTVRIQWNVEDSSPIQAGFYKGIKSSSLPASLSRTAKISSNIPSYLYSKNLVKIVVDTTGWYRLTKSMLQDSGVVITGVDPRTFRLWNRGIEQKIWVEGEEDGIFSQNDFILFFGKQNSNKNGNYLYDFYSDDNCYWLTWGDDFGERYGEELGYPNLPADQVLTFPGFPTVLHIERNEAFYRLGKIGLHETWDTLEHFFMSPPINEGTSVDFPVNIPYPRQTDSYLFSLTARFQGITSGDHSLSLFMNNVKSAEGNWSGQSPFTITSTQSQMWPNSDLNHGNNTVMVVLEGDNPGVEYDQVVLDWVDINYERLYQADKDYIEFTRPVDLNYVYQFEVGGFISPEIYVFKNDISRIRDFVTNYDEESQRYTIIFQDWLESSDIYYSAFSNFAVRVPKELKQVDPIESPLSEGGAPYLIITPETYLDVLEPLAELRSAKVVKVNDIYREYNDGVLSPYAIRNFLIDVYHNWQPVPDYVLLVGTAYIGKTENLNIPTMFYQSYKWGATATDYWYVLIEGNDFIPEFHIGRLPADTEEELNSMVKKIIAYTLHEDSGVWQNRFLMIGGYEKTFKDQSESFIHTLVREGFFSDRLYIDPYSEGGPYFGTTDTLIDKINRGTIFINFFGHGGGAIWGDRSLFTLSDVSLLENGIKLPVITSMTCFTGDMTNQNSLGRKLMEYENGGTVAFLGSSGIGWIINDYLLLQPIMLNLFSEDLTLGEIIDLGKIYYIAQNDSYPDIAKSLIYQYNLLGDPALQIRFPSSESITIEPKDPQPGEILTFSGFSNPPDSLYIMLYDIQNEPLFDQAVKVIKSEGSYSWQLPINLKEEYYSLNLSTQKSDSDVIQKHFPIYVSGSSIVLTSIEPSVPTHKDSIKVWAYISDRQGIDSAEAVLQGDSLYFIKMVEVDENTYSLEEAFPPQSPGQSIMIWFKVWDGDGNLTQSQTYDIDIRDLCDLLPKRLAFRIDNEINLVATIENTKLGFGSSEVVLERSLGSGQWELIGRSSVSFEGIGTKEVLFKGPFQRGIWAYRVRVNPDSLIDEYNYSNNSLIDTIETNAFWITPELGSTEDLVSHQSVGIEGFFIDVPSHVVSVSAPIEMIRLNQLNLDYQTGLIPISSDTSILGFRLNCPVDVDSFTVEWSWKHPVPNSGDLYRWYSSHNVWLPIELDSLKEDSMTIYFSANGVTDFAWFYSEDVEGPRVEATVNGIRFIPESYISTDPYISIVIQDENGVDFRSKSIQIFKNRVLFSPKIEIPETTPPDILTLRFSPQLTSLDTSISMIAKDAIGNWSDTLSLEFIVYEKMDLFDYGNFPNPFKDQTLFAYELTQTVDEFYLDIFSVSGRRVIRFSDETLYQDLPLKTAAYHEIYWDGRDENGNFVDNGIYFYRMMAKLGKKTLERFGKVAKGR